jgi:hypothetical protein
MKTCNKCKQHLDKSNFSPSSGGTYLRPECKECNRRLSKERKDLRKEFGLPDKNYVCPICLKGELELIGNGGNAGIWVVDHDHSTNTFRGHLCHNCNRAIGNFNDDVERIQRTIEYLNK